MMPSPSHPVHRCTEAGVPGGGACTQDTVNTVNLAGGIACHD
jgi:hypothetical protein